MIENPVSVAGWIVHSDAVAVRKSRASETVPKSSKLSQYKWNAKVLLYFIKKLLENRKIYNSVL